MTLFNIKRLALPATAAVLLAASASGALAFCFSNDPLSTTSFEVRNISTPDFLKKMEKLSVKVDCNKMPSSTARSKCFEAKARVDKHRRKSRDSSKSTFERDAQKALKDMYTYASGQPIIGEPTKVIAAGINAFHKANVAVVGAISDAHVDLFDWVIGNFKKKVGPDGKQCCNWRNKSCNPTGNKDGKLHFQIAYAGTSRVIEIGATDHLVCRVDKGKGKRSVCVNYVFPNSPFQAHKKTARSRLLKSKHTGKCLEVGGWKRKNGSNVNMWKCHGGKNQRWTVYKNGVIRNDHNGKCLDLITGPAKPAKNGVNVHVWDCHGGLSQRWSYGSNGKIISRARGTHNWCLEVGGWKKNDGANVNVWRCGGKQANQAWQSAKK